MSRATSCDACDARQASRAFFAGPLGRFNRVGNLLLWGAVLLASGCAKVGEPLPPIVLMPPVQDLAATVESDRVVLEFSLPKEEIAGVQILLSCGKPDPAEEDFGLMAYVSQAWLVPAADGKRYTFVDARRTSGGPCHYRVRLQDPSGRASSPSNRVGIP